MTYRLSFKYFDNFDTIKVYFAGSTIPLVPRVGELISLLVADECIFGKVKYVRYEYADDSIDVLIFLETIK